MRVGITLLLVLFLSALSQQALGNEIVLPTEPTDHHNTIPFGPEEGATHYQQAYAYSLFTELSSIEAIAFSPNRPLSGSYVYTANVAVSFGYTDRSVHGLTTDFASNVAGSLTQVFVDTAYSATLVKDTYSLVFDFSGTPFIFDPSRSQNLLLDIVISNQTLPGTPIYTGWAAVWPSAQSGRAYVTSNPDNPSDGGSRAALKTQFTLGESPVPEPSSLALLGLGLLAVVASWRKRNAG
ncbi:MAG: PEP-CTERM sorting domain-containing protein [Planctomycetota bacterium]|jgi:hypothetical protein